MIYANFMFVFVEFKYVFYSLQPCFIAINESVNISSVTMAPVCIYMYCLLFFYKGLQTHSLTLVTSNVQLLILSR